MSYTPTELKYSQNHEWLRAKDQDLYVVGITDHAQSLLGDIVFVDLPGVNETFVAGENCAVTESVKAASDVYAPISGRIIAINEALESAPDLVNRDPYGEGWLFIIQADNTQELNILLSAEAYQDFLKDQD